jgi:hypothetical protein
LRAATPTEIKQPMAENVPTPLPEVAATTDSPEWLEDMRLWVGLDLLTKPRQPERESTPVEAVPPPETPAPVDPSGTPEWLQEWMTEGVPEPQRRAPPPADVPLAEPVPPRRKKRKGKKDIPIAKPISRRPGDAIPVAEPVEAADAEVVDAEVVEGEVEAAEIEAVEQADILAEQARQQTGFDLKSGRVVDPVKFQQWRQQKAEAGQAGMTNASMMGAFREARTALERWVDDDRNRLRVVHASFDEIKRNKDIQQIYVQYAGYGFRPKLEKHLEMVVENRRKYYKAMEAAGR